ncbi:cupin domain-containing protein [Candidatus Parcubacteria bacterium]|nr:cupin domain-containing protein [Candidatus Parcubacteria bacterium]
MENKKFYIGSYQKNAKKRRGWIVGHFMSGLCKTDRVEIKYWRFKKGEVVKKEYKTQCCSVEVTIILQGKIDGEVDGREINLKAGEYIIIPPGVANAFPVNVYEDVEGLTIKSPSIPEDKIISLSIH